MLSKEEIKKIEEIGPSRFTFNGNIVAELGEESISNPLVAITELIKNSYDADAEQVNLDFINLGKINPEIVVSDDGEGMDSSQIKDHWLDIGSPHKKDIEETKKHHRIPVGAKGIGRFSAHCLGKNMSLITASKKERFGYNLVIDWGRFSSENKATDIDIKTGRFTKKISMKGTSIIVENLKHNWGDDEKLKSLLKDIYLLNNPIDIPRSFKIIPNIAKDYTYLKKINKSFLEKAAYHLKVKLTREKKINFYFYRENKLIKKDDKKIKEALSCGDVTFDLYFYYKSADAWKKRIKKDIDIKELREISSVLEEYGGIKIYRDKFRVKPYGDKNSDWIGLDKWSRDNTVVPGNTQVFGIVSVSKGLNPLIEDTTTREGVINNNAYFDLTKFVTTSIKLFVDLKGEQEPERAKKRKSKKKRKRLKVEKPRVEERPIVQEEIPFIDIVDSFPNTHYNQIIYEINECENHNYPNATFFLCRKLIENLVFHILYKKFGKKRIELWYDTERKRNLFFSDLIDNLWREKSSFAAHLEELISQFKIDVGTFRKDVNKAIHNNYSYLQDKSELKKYKIEKIVQILVDIYNGV